MTIGQRPAGKTPGLSGPSAATSANQWDNQNYPVPSSQTLNTSTGVSAPPVPSGNGYTGVSVDSDLLTVVGNNMSDLQQSVKKAYDRLNALYPLAPGAFWDAYQLQNKVGSPNDGTSSDLVSSYLAVLQDLGNGLGDVHNTLMTMGSKYKTFSDLNDMKTSDLDNDLAGAQSAMSNMMSDNGGSGPGSYPGGGSPVAPNASNAPSAGSSAPKTGTGNSAGGATSTTGSNTSKAPGK